MTARAFAAVDLGATSGRVVIGRVTSDRVDLEVVHRFANGPIERADGLHWDFDSLYENVLVGLARAVELEPTIESVGIDSWAVDYGLVRAGALWAEPFHYRDERGARGAGVVHEFISPKAVYARNGLQFLPFNTLYQFAADDRLAEADLALLIPDLIAYLLTSVAVAERTNASTTGLVAVASDRAGEWDLELADNLGVPARVLPPLVDPGTVLGTVRPEVAERIGAALTVVAVASHDTASAIVATPLANETSAYISCGTWGLVGLELPQPIVTDAAREANFTNERGLDGTIRFLHNVTGLWLLSECVRSWEAEDGATISLPDLLAEAAAYEAEVPLFDANDATLAAPGGMPERIAALVASAPASRAGFTRMVVESIAHAFAAAIAQAGVLAAPPTASTPHGRRLAQCAPVSSNGRPNGPPGFRRARRGDRTRKRSRTSARRRCHRAAACTIAGARCGIR